MCGIAGLFNRNGKRASEGDLLAMQRALVHRGPDGEGLWRHGPVGLAHRRLSVIDLEHGDQPMTSPDGRIVLIFNGEIYNFRELRADLERLGWVFRTRSDTEVLIAGYVLWGIEALASRIDGMAAFALWDAERGALHLVRDRYGAKPLYLWRRAAGLAFASEIKAFMAMPDFSVQLNRSALQEYFTFQNLFRPHTLFEGVEHLPPGSILTIDEGGETLRTYWRFDLSSPVELDARTASDTLRELFVEGVQRQLVSDVAVGAYLSGGVDSGAIVGAAAAHIPRLPTFTAGFEMSEVSGVEATFDERRGAEEIACRYRTEHFEQVINAGDIRWALPRVVWHLEDLRLGMSYPNYYIARLASKFVKVCLSGTGGDEIFGGYPWRYYRVFRSCDRTDYMRNYFDFWQRLTSAEDRREMFGTEARDDDLFDVFTSVYDGEDNLRFSTVEDHISNALLFECKTFLPGLLTVGDKLSMAHGLEERFPFLDNKVVEFGLKLPVRLKLGDLDQMLAIDEDEVRKKLLAQQQFDAGKTTLRQAVSGFLPARAVKRKKQGFSSPEASWYRGENAAYVREILLSDDLVMADYIDPGFVRRIVAEHMAEAANHRLLIWSLLSFEWWCRLFLDGRSVEGMTPDFSSAMASSLESAGSVR